MAHPIQYLDGWFAHKANVSQAENPYSERTQPWSNDLWGQGWTARWNAGKHDGDGDLDLDSERYL